MTEFLVPSLLLVVGLVTLLGGGEFLVRGASALAAVLKISPLVIGLTVVAFGTSAPELAVTVQATAAGESDLAVGNVVGSCICNVLLVLGVSALVAPLVVASRMVWLDVPIMVASSVAVLVMGWNGHIGRVDGLLLVLALAIYTVWSIQQGRRESREVIEEYEKQVPKVAAVSIATVWIQVGLVVAGLVLLTLGAHWLVNGAVTIARLLGVGELMIGLTIVALGTSLPEVATSVLASARGERDIAVGNVVGSNIMNILCVLGFSGLMSSEGVTVSQTALQFDIPVMIAVAVACLPIFFTGHLIARWEGALFLGYYVAYNLYLIFTAIHYEGMRTFKVIMVGIVIPLTVITLLVEAVRYGRQRWAARSK